MDALSKALDDNLSDERRKEVLDELDIAMFGGALLQANPVQAKQPMKVERVLRAVPTLSQRAELRQLAADADSGVRLWFVRCVERLHLSAGEAFQNELRNRVPHFSGRSKEGEVVDALTAMFDACPTGADGADTADDADTTTTSKEKQTSAPWHVLVTLEDIDILNRLVLQSQRHRLLRAVISCATRLYLKAMWEAHFLSRVLQSTSSPVSSHLEALAAQLRRVFASFMKLRLSITQQCLTAGSLVVRLQATKFLETVALCSLPMEHYRPERSSTPPVCPVRLDSTMFPRAKADEGTDKEGEGEEEEEEEEAPDAAGSKKGGRKSTRKTSAPAADTTDKGKAKMDEDEDADADGGAATTDGSEAVRLDVAGSGGAFALNKVRVLPNGVRAVVTREVLEADGMALVQLLIDRVLEQRLVSASEVVATLNALCTVARFRYESVPLIVPALALLARQGSSGGRDAATTSSGAAAMDTATSTTTTGSSATANTTATGAGGASSKSTGANAGDGATAVAQLSGSQFASVRYVLKQILLALLALRCAQLLPFLWEIVVEALTNDLGVKPSVASRAARWVRDNKRAYDYTDEDYERERAFRVRFGGSGSRGFQNKRRKEAGASGASAGGDGAGAGTVEDMLKRLPSYDAFSPDALATFVIAFMKNLPESASAAVDPLARAAAAGAAQSILSSASSSSSASAIGRAGARGTPSAAGAGPQALHASLLALPLTQAQHEALLHRSFNRVMAAEQAVIRSGQAVLRERLIVKLVVTQPIESDVISMLLTHISGNFVQRVDLAHRWLLAEWFAEEERKQRLRNAKRALLKAAGSDAADDAPSTRRSRRRTSRGKTKAAEEPESNATKDEDEEEEEEGYSRYNNVLITMLAQLRGRMKTAPEEAVFYDFVATIPEITKDMLVMIFSDCREQTKLATLPGTSQAQSSTSFSLSVADVSSVVDTTRIARVALGATAALVLHRPATALVCLDELLSLATIHTKDDAAAADDTTAHRDDDVFESTRAAAQQLIAHKLFRAYKDDMSSPRLLALTEDEASKDDTWRDEWLDERIAAHCRAKFAEGTARAVAMYDDLLRVALMAAKNVAEKQQAKMAVEEEESADAEKKKDDQTSEATEAGAEGDERATEQLRLQQQLEDTARATVLQTTKAYLRSKTAMLFALSVKEPALLSQVVADYKTYPEWLRELIAEDMSDVLRQLGPSRVEVRGLLSQCVGAAIPLAVRILTSFFEAMADPHFTLPDSNNTNNNNNNNNKDLTHAVEDEATTSVAVKKVRRQLAEAAKELYWKDGNGRIEVLLPVTAGLTEPEVLSLLPAIVSQLSGDQVRHTIRRLACVDAPFFSPLTPVSLLIWLHRVEDLYDIEQTRLKRQLEAFADADSKRGKSKSTDATRKDTADEEGGEESRVFRGSLMYGANVVKAQLLKKSRDAIDVCFEAGLRVYFTQDTLAVALQKISGGTSLKYIPKLFMRTVILSLAHFKPLTHFVVANILPMLIQRAVWNDESLWKGFVKCCVMLGREACRVLVRLPSRQLSAFLDDNSGFVPFLIEHRQKVRLSIAISEVIDKHRSKAQARAKA